MSRIEIMDQGYVHKPNRDAVFTYAGWPSVALAADGALVVAYSGGRVWHLCPFGQEHVRRSDDMGKTWSEPTVAYSSPLDDRDAALTRLNGHRMALNFFTVGREQMLNTYFGNEKGTKATRLALDYLDMLPDNVDETYAGRFMMFSEDDGRTWGTPVRTPVFTPGGFKRMKDGAYIIVSQFTREEKRNGVYARAVYRSEDGRDWTQIGRIPVCPEAIDYLQTTQEAMYMTHTEPEVVQMADGRLLCLLRMENQHRPGMLYILTLASSISQDGGYTWSVPKILGTDGAPAGLLSHSTGAVIATYGSRRAPFGIKTMVSWDMGKTWTMDLPLYTPQVDGIPAGSHDDNGYAKSVELPDGDIFTVFYAKEHDVRQCAVRYVRWRLCK